MLRVIGAVFWPPDWLPSAYDERGAGAGAGAGAAAVREAFWALAFAASSSVPCVAQPAAVTTAAATVASARARRVFMVSPCLGKNTLSLKLYLRKCFRVPGGYHWRREKCRPAAPHARGSGAVPHHRKADQAALPGRRAPFAPEGRPAVGARPGGRKPRRHRGRPGARARHPPVDRQQPAARARARRAGHARAGEHGPAPGAAVRDEEGLEALEGGAAPVRMSCSFGLSPRPLIGSPFSESAVSFVMFALSECSSATFFATTTPLALRHGPLPTRSRALTPASPPGSEVLRYAFQLLCFEAAALASALQCASAPSSPPRSAPLPLPTLVTKNVMSPLDAGLPFALSCACTPLIAVTRMPAATITGNFIALSSGFELG